MSTEIFIQDIQRFFNISNYGKFKCKGNYHQNQYLHEFIDAHKIDFSTFELSISDGSNIKIYFTDFLGKNVQLSSSIETFYYLPKKNTIVIFGVKDMYEEKTELFCYILTDIELESNSKTGE